MRCHRTGGTCNYTQCPMYLKEMDACMDVLIQKNRLNILTSKEKRSLTSIRTSDTVATVHEN